MSNSPATISAVPHKCNPFRGLARASWIAPLIGLLVNFGSVAAFGGNSNFTGSLISFAFLVLGLLLGIVALFGIKKYGKSGILIPALIGICIPLVLTVLALPFIQTHHRPAPPPEPIVHSSSAHLLDDERLHFSMYVPDGFTNCSGQTPANVEHCFVRDLPDHNDLRLVISVQQLGGIIPQNEPLYREDAAKQAPPGVKLSLIQKNWRGFKVDTFVTEQSQNGIQLVAYAVQIPLVPNAIQINVGGPVSRRAELEKLTDEIVASVGGDSNWR